MRRGKPREREIKKVKAGPFPYDWERIDEQPDPTMLRQENEQRCTAACVLLLAGGEEELSQADLAGDEYLAGEPAAIDRILATLRKLDCDGRWALRVHGEEESFDHLKVRTPWLAVLILSRPGIQFEGHAVIVEEMGAAGDVLIRDPLQATHYWMRREAFNSRWNGMAFFRTGRKKGSGRKAKRI